MEVIPGIKVQSAATVQVTDYRGFNLSAELTVTPDGKVAVEELSIRRRDDSPSITGESLRSIAVQSIVREYVRMEIRKSTLANIPDGADVVAQGLLTRQEADRLRSLGPTAETLEWVAKVYKLAEFLGDAPTRAVEDSFGVSRSTAGSWIGRARAANLIPPVQEGDPR